MKKSNNVNKNTVGAINIDPKKTNSSAIDLKNEDLINKNVSAEFNLNNMNTLG